MLETDFIPAPEKNSGWLMVVLHGLGDSMEGFRWLPSYLRLPWLNFLLVNAPDPYYGGYAWYDFAQDAEPGVRRSHGLLQALLERQREAGFASERTFLFGFSQGCLMTIEVGARHPRLLAGLVGISGYVHRPETLVRELSPVARQQHFLVTHGTRDPLLPVGPVRQQFAQLQAAGLNVDWHEFVKEHTIAGESEIQLVRGFLEQRRAGVLSSGPA